jgi:GT2 family glycosyltransferase
LKTRVGIVVPTLGKRPDYLHKCLRSIRQAGEAYVCLVAPKDFDAQNFLDTGLVNQIVVDPGLGLPEAINHAFEQLPRDIEFINWLGDDDLLQPGSLAKTSGTLQAEPETVLAYGSCNYIDSNGEIIWVNKSGQWASPLLHVGPDLIPQPGALFRRAAFEQVGGLSTEFNWAFDFDLLLKLRAIGKLKFVNQTLASFRWHPESLSVGQRKMSVSEAGRVRISHLPKLLRFISFLWEYPVRKATMVAGNRVTAKAQGKKH